jgi:hypothetical protein
MIVPASAQFWGSWDRRPQQQPQRQAPPQQYNPFGTFWGPGDRQREREREAPADNSRAPNPQKNPNPAAATTVVVVGDGMADWLASGLEDAFSEKPEIAIVRKHRTASGLIRYDTRRDVEWAQVVKETITADKPKFIVMMLGVNDRQQIRERAPTTPAAAARQTTPAKPAPAEPAATPDPELQAQQSADQQNAEQQEAPEPAPIAAPEPRGAQGNLGPFEFHTEKWEAAYVRRIDATIAAMKSAGVPVLWVGLPSQRNSRASTDSTYLNDLYRQRAEKAGIIYVDIWDGFVDDAGRFNQQGPDFEGQIRRLRSADGIYFTKPGARKLAHYVEREILRSITNRALPVALPAVEPAPATPGARPGSPARPLAGPVVPLTVSAGGGDELLGAARVVRPAAVDPVATRVLTKGEAIAAPSGRADDFNWPRGSVPTAVVEPASAPAGASASAPAAPARGQAASSGQQAEDTKPAAQPAPKRARPAAPQADAPPRPPAAVRPSASSSPSPFWNIR